MNLKKLTIVIDMVNGFCKFGAMSDKKILQIIPNIKYQIKNSDDVVFICDSHDENDLEMKAYPTHCLANDKESEVVDELKEFQTGSNTILKKSTNGFINFDKNLLYNFDEFILVGCCTDICVLQFALSLRTFLNEKNIDKKVIVPQNCVETYDSPIHNRNYYNECALNLMKNAAIEVK